MRQFSSRRRKPGPFSPMELLEARALLANTPYPLISDLLNPNDTVVRFQTNFGDVDFELFDSAAPITVTNFLKYIRDGDYDKTFFHRFAKDQSNNPFVIQGGLARLQSPTNTGTFTSSAESIPTDPPIQNEFNQSNLIRTLAMARVGGQVNSATSQFFINLKDNQFLDTVDQGFTVFGRVANNASWTVVQSIISGVSISNQGSPFNELPTTNGFTGTDVSEDQLVTIRDAEIIKPQGVAAFYNFKYYYPEGFAGSTINEFLPLGNVGASNANYQVIVRSETRDPKPSGNVDFWYRDKVIGSGVINAHSRGGLTVSSSQNPSSNLVPRQGKPYAYEVWSTGPLAATLSHYDFGSSTIESFATTPGTTWMLPDVRKGTSINDYAVWQNTTDQMATITAKFIFNGAAAQTFTFTTEAFRRGGLSIADFPTVPDGTFSLELTSDRPIIAALTHYKTSGTDKGGSTGTGITGLGATSAVLPVANVGASGSTTTDFLSFVNTNSTGAIVTLIFSFTDGSPDVTISPASLILAPNSRATYDISQVPSLADRSFSVRYTSGSTKIFASTTHVEHNDVASNPFAYSAATNHMFGEGFMNGGRANIDLFETLAIYNPWSSQFGATPTQANVAVRFLFTDGFVLTQDYTIDSGRRLELDLGANAGLIAQNANNRYFYSIEVVSDIAVIAMMRHYDTTLGNLQASGGGSMIGTQRGQVIALSDLNGM